MKNDKYQTLAKMLKAVLSFVHSTAKAEGSIKDVRNVLGSYSHRSSDETCGARLVLLSSVRAADSCCFDYTRNQKEHEKNWKTSWKSQNDTNNEEEGTDTSGSDSEKD